MKKIPLTQGKVAVVDDEDYDWLIEWKWSYADYPNCGAFRNQLKGESEDISLKMHRAIWERHNGPIPEDLLINFIDGNGLNNKKQNLRLATWSQSQWNQKPRTGCTSQYKGVAWQDTKWRSKIKLNGKQIHLGYFDDEKEAARTYNKAALTYFGEFAQLNEIEKD